MTLVNGQILRQRYQIQSLLGQGGFGAVYKAIDLNLNRWCAVKENILEPTMTPAQIQAQQQQFQREAMMLSRLRHPRLPQIHDYFIEPNSQQYLVMEFVEGTDLHTLVLQRGALPERQVTAWMTQVLDALAYLHTQQPPIIHRDIKPQNVIVTPQGNAMLVDFGIAKQFVAGQATTRGARAVSPGYSPPEQYGQGTTDPRSDIYSVGATMYFAPTGTEPPESVQLVATPGMLRAPRQSNPQISSNTERVILHAMSIQPSSRPAAASEMRRALTQQSPQIQLPMQPASAWASPSIAASVGAPVAGSAAWPQGNQPAAPGRNRSWAFLAVPIAVGNLSFVGWFVISISVSIIPAIGVLCGLAWLVIPIVSPFLLGYWAARRDRHSSFARLSLQKAAADGVISGFLGNVLVIVCYSLLLSAVGIAALSSPSGAPNNSSGIVVVLLISLGIGATVFSIGIFGAIGGLIARASSG